MRFKEKLAAREVAGELYIVDIEAETLHSLNPSALFIWDCLKKGMDSCKTAVRLAAEFEVTPVEAVKDVRVFVKTLEVKGLVRE